MKTKINILLVFLMIFCSSIVIASSAGTPVKVVEVSLKNIEIDQMVNGVIEPFKNILISSKTGGILENVCVQIGQSVKANDILLVFEKDQILAQIAQAEAALEISMANLTLTEKGASKEDLKLAQSSLAQAQASYQAALNNLNYANLIFEDRTMEKQQLLGVKTQVEVSEKQLKMAEERYLQTELALEIAKTDYERMTKLYQEGAITQKQFEGVESQYKNTVSTFNSAKLSKEQAEISYESAIESYQLAQEIFENRTTAKQQVDGAETQVDIAQANFNIAEANLTKLKNGASIEQLSVGKASVKQTKATLNLIQLQLKNCTVLSPIDGIVAQVNADSGEMVGPGTPVLTVIDIDEVYVKADVTAEILRFLHEGDNVKVKVRAYPEEYKEGQIALISPMADLRTQAFLVKVILKNDNHDLKPGMFADLTLTLQKSANTSVIPIDAVMNLEDDPYVYVVNSSSAGQKTVQKRIIQIGLVTDKEVEIISGLQNGEKVVINGQYSLHDGDIVEVITNENI